VYSNKRPKRTTRVKEKATVETQRQGIMKPISTSKTIKIIATRKNFIQNEQCEWPRGSKPHS